MAYAGNDMVPSRIVIINDRSIAAGGATALALLSARLFSEAGIRVTYATGDDGSQAQLPSSVDLNALGGKPLLQRGFASQVREGLYNSTARRFLEDTIAKLDAPDVVYHLHGWAQILSPSVFSPLSKVSDRLVVHAHDFFMACPNGAFFDFSRHDVCHRSPMSAGCLSARCDKRSTAQKAFRVARHFVRQRTFPAGQSPAAIVLIHPAMAPLLEKSDLVRDRMRVVRNPARAFLPTRVAAEQNSDIFFIGRVTQEKGLRVAAEAAQLAGRRLRVIGDGPDRAQLAADFPEIVWDGWLDHSVIAERIGTARALVMPSSLPEPFGLVAVEALQSGVPLIAFSDAMIAQEAESLGCAILAAERTPQVLAEAMRRLDDDGAVQEASERAYKFSPRLTCTQDEWRDRLLDLYSDLLVQAERTHVRQPNARPSPAFVR
ncbi:glycosyltransferase [Qipengyuania sp. G39]|uniref:Glycosyltransferase n=1 Tax=Qipengyuania profundimaris TaxID=3067652 RepID=A0ABT9HPH5_9SPHN|nr:glycosyltransferase [Qipengyuania sp. G39]MDP4574925.1 glycosyltransferase [Qipengyuania sp. G39]